MASLRSEDQEPTETQAMAYVPRDAQGMRVTVLAGRDAGLVCAVPRRSAIIGRVETAEVRLGDPLVSAFHAELTTTDRRIRVVDLDSKNGTHYAGATIERGVVPSGATLEVGESLVRVEIDASINGEARSELASFGELRGASTASRELFSTLARLARTDLSVLLEGATGTGKELAARAMHAESAHAGGPFVVLDCTAIPSQLAESMLFGHERGAFTGATERQLGIFEAADGGTVFLDEIGELPLALQPKLLRVLERREIVRVGSTQPRPVRVRVICATWRDLRTMINQGAFREDLYFRLAGARVLIPSLRDRPDDIAVLSQHFLQKRDSSAPGARAIAPDAVDELAGREYPGNVRELRSVLERAALVAEGGVITTTDLAFERMLSGESAKRSATAQSSKRPSVPPEGPIAPFKTAKRTLIDEFEQDYLRRLLERTGNNLSRAAALAGVDRNYLRDLCRKHSLRSDEA